MKYILLLTAMLFVADLHAQTDTVKNAPKVYSIVSERPDPKFDITSYLRENLHFPAKARRKDIEGRVIVKFIVNEDGKVSDVTIVKGIGGGCDEEARRVVENMPAWKAGIQDGKPVKVYFTLPIQFKLR